MHLWHYTLDQPSYEFSHHPTMLLKHSHRYFTTFLMKYWSTIREPIWKVEIETFLAINLHCQKKEEGNVGVLRGSRGGQEDQIPLQNSNFLNLNYKYQRYASATPPLTNSNTPSPSEKILDPRMKLYLKEIQICKKWYLFILFQYFDIYTSTLR